ncbi:hypothetical protein JNB88_21470 [Rhizobium cauense]|uniref:hypothetical protein n=1 Tax=Rhizobium cauense TaxID=1166683 RepID=UPI000567A577|nr:hypothetical protein [Rhizobium cauense]MBW9116213.1 hypothetical protein [Rhizobium cauense]
MQRLVVQARRVAELQYNEALRKLTIVYRSGRSRPLDNIDRNMVLKLISQLSRKNIVVASYFTQFAACI